MTERSQAWRCPPGVVLAAVDFEPASRRAASLAGFVAAGVSASLRVVHAERFDVPPYFTRQQIARLDVERHEARVELETELKRMVGEATSWPGEVTVIEGPPVETILQAADAADLVVLGTHGRHGPSRWWLGSVAERVVRGARVPVLVTRDDATPLDGVLAHVTLVGVAGEPDDDALRCAMAMVAPRGGHVAVRGRLDTCAADALAAATLVAMAMPEDSRRGGLPDVVIAALEQCARPVLFLPAGADAGGRR